MRTPEEHAYVTRKIDQKQRSRHHGLSFSRCVAAHLAPGRLVVYFAKLAGSGLPSSRRRIFVISGGCLSTH
jgi:hypothetical protein